MAKNFTQFQEISGTADATTGLREHNLPDGVDKTDAYVVGYVDDTAGGEARFTLQSILLACDKTDIGLNNVTNESKSTMFNNPHFTTDGVGSYVTVTGDLKVTGSIEATGNLTSVDTVNVATSALVCYNDGTATPLRVTQAQNTYDVAQFKSGSAMALHIDQDGRVGIGGDAVADHQLVVEHIPGQSSSEATVLVVGSLSATGLVNGANIPEIDDKLATIDFFATNWTSLHDIENQLTAQNAYIQQNGGTPVPVGKGFDLLEDGDTYVKILSAWTPSPAPDTGHKASIDWQYDEGLGINPNSGGVPIAGEPKYGTWDASYEKLRKIEYGADNTRANSGNIDYSQVPDGPYTGDDTTSFVKMTSAERIALGAHSSVTGEPGGIRTVSKTLYTGDDSELLTASHIASAYEEQADYHWSESKDDEYSGIGTGLRTDGTPGIRPRANQAVLNQTATQLPDGDADLGSVTVDTLSGGVVIVEDEVVVTNPGTASSNPLGADYKGVSTSIDVGGTILHIHNGIIWKIVDSGGTATWNQYVP